MKKIFILIIIVILQTSCKENNNLIISENFASDSLSYYIKKINEVSKDSLELKNEILIKALDLNNLHKKNSKYRDNLSKILIEFYNIGDLSNVKYTSFLLLENSIDDNDSLNIFKSYRYLAASYRDENILDSSFYYYIKAEKCYLNKKKDIDYAFVTLNKGIIQSKINDFIGSELSLLKSYYIYKDNVDYNNLYNTLNQLGLVYNELNDFYKAIDFHNKALKIVVESDFEDENLKESVCYNNIGYLYIKKENYKLAIENFNLGLKNSNVNVDDPDLYSLLIDNLAFCKLKLKEYNDVPQLFQNALKIRDSLKDVRLIVLSNIHLSEYYDAIKDTTFSIRYSKKALQLAKDSQNPFDIVLSLKQAASVDKKNSSEYTSDYIKISDSLQNEERKNLDRFARIQLETDELIKENTFLTEKNKRIIGLVFAFGSILLILFYSRTQFLKNKYLLLEQSQQRANEDIYRLVISEQDSIDHGKNLEKKRIAKELHDGVLGRLFGLRLNLDMLNSRDDNQVSKDRKSFLNELQLIEQDIREISHELSREKIELINNFLSLTNALFENQAKIGKAKLQTEIDTTINWDLLSNSTRINLY
ncbi:tetratricopeptide repeat protein, partial [Flavobacterium sp.]|uniref:ATP-binding protein n=1 Tax=Flavobacterium sp. TaxID=239 RepID=UPI0037515E5B